MALPCAGFGPLRGRRQVASRGNRSAHCHRRRRQQKGYAVTLFEANGYAGGHTHTVDVTLDGVTHPVDTGFLVFNERTYPRLCALLDALGVASVPSDMSFACR